MMVRRTSAILCAGFVCAGFTAAALATPATRDTNNVRDTGKHDVQLDRAALFRPAQVAECGAVQRERVTPAQTRQRDRTGRAPKKTAANFGCNAVWTD